MKKGFLNADEANKYSRAILTLGEDAHIALKSSSVLISGTNGLGIEIAKNVVLSGVKVGFFFFYVYCFL
jgi:molybdopterin/thiamine biosynthesis adenylyltransferase